MDQYHRPTGWRRFHSNVRYRHMIVTSVFVFFARLIEHVIHTHDRYEMYTGEWQNYRFAETDCTVAEKRHHKNNDMVYCVRNNTSKWTKNIYVGPRVNYVGPQDTRLGAWLIMSDHRLLTLGPKLIRREYGRGPEMNISGPKLIMSGPLSVMPGPEISISGPRLIMSGPLLVMSGPRDNYVGARLIMSGPLTNYFEAPR